MKFIDDLKNTIGRNALKSRVKSVNRQMRAFNIKDVRTAGIILNASDIKTFELAQNFYKYLKSLNIDTWSLGYADDENVIKAYSYQIGMNHFTKKHLNWYNKPSNSSADQFIEKEFDLLVDLTMEEFFPLYYILGASKAKFKVGKFYENNSYYDLMIDIDKSKKMDFFIEQIKHYLSLINTK